ncbi:MAG: hypothetical protein WDN03_13610 [Rhizomicrobium sp.]
MIHRTPLRLLAFVAIAGLAANCAVSLPTGTVTNAREAIAVANTACSVDLGRFPGPWHVELKSGTWIAWKQQDGLRVTIDAETGTATDCEVAH